MSRTVCLGVDVANDSELPRVLETLGRAMAGLVLEGLDVRIFAYSEDDVDPSWDGDPDPGLLP